MGSSNGQANLKTSFGQYIKTYSVYDPISFLLTEFYEAPADAADGTPCMVTYFEYDGASTRVLKQKEADAVWDSAWDI